MSRLILRHCYLTVNTMTKVVRTYSAMAVPKTMKAVGFYEHLPLKHPRSLEDVEVPVPTPNDNDLLVQVKATSVNPIDTKVRNLKGEVENGPRILGWDGAGVIVGKGNSADKFNIGDEVMFTGDIRRNGSNAEYVAINQLLVGHKPQHLTFEQAAAIPLTTVTAYESLFDRMLLSEGDAGKTLLIINSAGGVGSMASQLAKNIGLKVIGTASRFNSTDFSYENGASIVINHSRNIIDELKKNAIAEVDFILVNYDPYPYWDVLMTIIKPQGKICLIVDASNKVDIKPLKDKSVTLLSESMLTRIKYDIDMNRHFEILKIISKMFEEGKLKSTLTKTFSPINSENLKEAHRLLEEKLMVGKLVLNGF